MWMLRCVKRFLWHEDWRPSDSEYSHLSSFLPSAILSSFIFLPSNWPNMLTTTRCQKHRAETWTLIKEMACSEHLISPSACVNEAVPSVLWKKSQNLLQTSSTSKYLDLCHTAGKYRTCIPGLNIYVRLRTRPSETLFSILSDQAHNFIHIRQNLSVARLQHYW